MTNNVKNRTINSPETLQVLPKATHEAHNPTNISKANPKTAKVHKSLPKVTPRLPKGTKKAPKSYQKAPQKASQNES